MTAEREYLPPLPDELTRPQAVIRMFDGRPFVPSTGYWLQAWRDYARSVEDRRPGRPLAGSGI